MGFGKTIIGAMHRYIVERDVLKVERQTVALSTQHRECKQVLAMSEVTTDPTAVGHPFVSSARSAT